VSVQCPPNRTDIGEGTTGKADLMEEITRLYGYDRIPSCLIADELPPQQGNKQTEFETLVKNILVSIGLQETINYRLTSPEEEARGTQEQSVISDEEYVELLNPISQDKRVMRSTLIPQMLTNLEKNARYADRLQLFEVGPVFLRNGKEILPKEQYHLCIGLTGLEQKKTWSNKEDRKLDFYDLKGIIEALLDALHVENIVFKPGDHSLFHPGKCAALYCEDQEIGSLGEVHPVIAERYTLAENGALIADINLDLLAKIISPSFRSKPVSTYPPVLEDLAMIVPEEMPSSDVEAVIRNAGGELLADVVLFDVFKGDQIGSGKKSLAYNLVFQAYDRTLTDKNVEKTREKIIKALENQIQAVVRKK
jgi:phenylalanyl-tRNA synthetase beta chain